MTKQQILQDLKDLRDDLDEEFGDMSDVELEKVAKDIYLQLKHEEL